MQKALIIFIAVMVIVIIIELINVAHENTPVPDNNDQPPVSYLYSTT